MPSLPSRISPSCFSQLSCPASSPPFSYLTVIAIYVRLKPEMRRTGPRLPWAERIPALIAVWPVVLIFFRVVGGIYLGWFTPTQAAAVGAAGTGLVAGKTADWTGRH